MGSRRTFLKRLSLISLAPSVPAFLAQTARASVPEQDRRILVVIQLDGGNDGINTVIPYADEGYARHRSKLRLPVDRLIKISDQVGLHPAMGEAGKLLESGRLAIVQGVGYPNPSRSHDVSMAIWQTCRFSRAEHTGLGWIGRALDDDPRLVPGSPDAVLVGQESPPVSLRGRRSVTSVVSDFRDYELASTANPLPPTRRSEPEDNLSTFVRRSTLDAYTTAARLKEIARPETQGPTYPATELAPRLHLIARLIKAGLEARVYYAVQPGYDTHSVQLPAQDRLLREFSGALRAFLDDLAASHLAERVVVLAFSEFGRRVAENASQGTDHGTAGPAFLAGPNVLPGLLGSYPSLTDLEAGDLKLAVDFRRVYASVLTDWLGLSSTIALGGPFESLLVLQNGLSS